MVELTVVADGSDGTGSGAIILAIPPSAFAVGLGARCPARLAAPASSVSPRATNQARSIRQAGRAGGASGGGGGAGPSCSTRRRGCRCGAPELPAKRHLSVGTGGPQRCARELRLPLHSIDTVFFTRLDAGTTAGFAGLVYALSDRGAPAVAKAAVANPAFARPRTHQYRRRPTGAARLEAFGPPGLAGWIAATQRAFLRRRHPQVCLSDAVAAAVARLLPLLLPANVTAEAAAAVAAAVAVEATWRGSRRVGGGRWRPRSFGRLRALTPSAGRTTAA
jgi:hypothetical protein